MPIDNINHHHGQSQASIHVSTLTAAAAAAAHLHSSSQMSQVCIIWKCLPRLINSVCSFIFFKLKCRFKLQTRRPLTAPRRNYARIHWPAPPHSHHHHHHHHPGPVHPHRMHQPHQSHHHQAISHQPQLPIQTGIINSGILLNFL